MAGPARIREAEQLGGLVEGLAGGIVDGRRQPPVVADPEHFENLAMPAGHEQQQVREVEVWDRPAAGLSAWPSRWLTATSGLPAASASPLPVSSATMTPPISPGPAVAATASTSPMATFASLEHPPDEVGKDLHVGTRGDFGNDPAERPVRVVLRDDGLGQDLPLARHQRRGGVVAGGFEAED